MEGQPTHASACDITRDLISMLYLHLTLFIALLQRVNALYRHIRISNNVEVHLKNVEVHILYNQVYAYYIKWANHGVYLLALTQPNFITNKNIYACS